MRVAALLMPYKPKRISTWFSVLPKNTEGAPPLRSKGWVIQGPHQEWHSDVEVRLRASGGGRDGSLRPTLTIARDEQYRERWATRPFPRSLSCRYNPNRQSAVLRAEAPGRTNAQFTTKS